MASDLWLDGVSPEATSGIPDLLDTVGAVDADGTVNVIGTNDLDRHDNGVVFYPLTYLPGDTGRVDVTVCVADPAGGRYALDNDRALWINGWIDWNTDGDWSDTGNAEEHVVDGVRLNPGTWTVTARRNPIVPGKKVTSVKVLAGQGNCRTVQAEFPVPAQIGQGALWSRFRLDYGEDAGRNDPRPGWRSDPSLRDPALAPGQVDNPNLALQRRGLALGASHYGEIEDYLLGTDFGDAFDDPANPRYPTLLRNKGAFSLNFNREWLGPRRGPGSSYASASRELDACDLTPAEEDRMANQGFPENKVCRDANADLRDTGLTIPGVVVQGTEITYQVTVSTQVATRGFSNTSPDGSRRSAGMETLKPNCKPEEIAATAFPTPPASRDLGRYAAWDPRRRLYLNVWVDWNGDEKWSDDAAEHILKNAPVDPEDFGPDGSYKLGERFLDFDGDGVYDPDADDFGPIFDLAGNSTRTFTCKHTVPANLTQKRGYFWRARLTYGEDTTANDQVRRYAVVAAARGYAGVMGGSYWGEVEDAFQTNKALLIDSESPSEGEMRFETADGEVVLVPLTGRLRFSCLVDEVLDPDADGREEIPVIPIELQSEGRHERLGAFIIRLAEAGSEGRVGILEERVNMIPGVLDLPPMAQRGTGDTRLDVALIVEMNGRVMMTAAPLRIESAVTAAPLAVGE